MMVTYPLLCHVHHDCVLSIHQCYNMFYQSCGGCETNYKIVSAKEELFSFLSAFDYFCRHGGWLGLRRMFLLAVDEA